MMLSYSSISQIPGFSPADGMIRVETDLEPELFGCFDSVGRDASKTMSLLNGKILVLGKKLSSL